MIVYVYLLKFLQQYYFIRVEFNRELWFTRKRKRENRRRDRRKLRRYRSKISDEYMQLLKERGREIDEGVGSDPRPGHKRGERKTEGRPKREIGGEEGKTARPFVTVIGRSGGDRSDRATRKSTWKVAITLIIGLSKRGHGGGETLRIQYQSSTESRGSLGICSRYSRHGVEKGRQFWFALFLYRSCLFLLNCANKKNNN